MAKYILVVLLVCFVAIYAYWQKESETATPRQALDKAVASAKETRSLTREQEEVLRVQIALLDYMSRKGAPPSTLKELIPEYFDEIPKNPATGKPFEYQRDGRSYHLTGSSEVEQPQVASSSGDAATPRAGKESEGAKGGDTALAANVTADIAAGDFVNPNTMAPSTFVYNPVGKRDPFKQFNFSARPQNPNAGTPLERYSLGQLRLTAVIVDPKTGVAQAFVEDAAGKGYPIKIGAKVGDQGGVVVGNEPDRIKVLENQTDFTGKVTQRVSEMRIQSQQNAPADKKR